MFILGLNHKTAPIEIREKFFLNHAQQDLLLSQLRSNPLVAECFILSTCNRVEVYIKRVESTFNGEQVIDAIAAIKKIQITPQERSCVYLLEGEAAQRHLLNVVCGLDSLVIGEKQILGQVKTSVERAREIGTLSSYFNILTNVAIRAGKKAQHETAISSGGLSISWAAIEQAQQELDGSLEGKKVLVIGAGKMGEIALSQLNNRGVGKIYLMNRTGEKAEDLAKAYNGIPASFFDMKDILSEVDVCFCCVGAPHYILNQEMVSKVLTLRKANPLVFIDISMPRNIDPSVAALPNVRLKAIDDLQETVQVSLLKRAQAVNEVQGIIQQKLAEFNIKIERLKQFSGSDYYEPLETVD